MSGPVPSGGITLGALTANPRTYRKALGVESNNESAFDSSIMNLRAAVANIGSAPVTALLVSDSTGVGWYASTGAKAWWDVCSSILYGIFGQPPAQGAISFCTDTSYTGRVCTAAGVLTNSSQSGIGLSSAILSANTGSMTSASIMCDRIWYCYPDHSLAGSFTPTVGGVAGASVSPISNGSSIKGGRVWDSGALTRAARTFKIAANASNHHGETMIFWDGNGNTTGSVGKMTPANGRTGKGLRMLNGSHFGYHTGHFTTAAGDGRRWTDGFDALAPNLVIINLMINCIVTNRGASVYQADLGTMVSWINAAMPNGTNPPVIVFMVPWLTGATAAASTPYVQATYDAAVANNAQVLDLGRLIGYVGGSGTTDLWGFTSSLDNNDRKHPTDLGHNVIGRAVAGYLARLMGAPAPAGLVAQTDGSPRARVTPSGDIVLGGATLATNATSGFPRIPVVAGAPTGTPTTDPDFVPIVADSTNNKLWLYVGGAWKGVVVS